VTSVSLKSRLLNRLVHVGRALVLKAHFHNKVVGIHLVVGTNLYGQNQLCYVGAEQGTITQRIDFISTFQMMHKKIRQGCVLFIQ